LYPLPQKPVSTKKGKTKRGFNKERKTILRVLEETMGSASPAIKAKKQRPIQRTVF